LRGLPERERESSFKRTSEEGETHERSEEGVNCDAPCSTPTPNAAVCACAGVASVSSAAAGAAPMMPPPPPPPPEVASEATSPPLALLLRLCMATGPLTAALLSTSSALSSRSLPANPARVLGFANGESQEEALVRGGRDGGWRRTTAGAV